MQTLRIPVPGGTLELDDFGGDGAPVLCLPGLGDVRGEYRFLAPLLARAGLRPIVVDLRGHGGSSVGFTSHGPVDIARDALAVMDALGVGRAVLVGCSISAAAVAWIAAKHPERVAGVVAIGPFVRQMPNAGVMALVGRVLTARPWGPWAWAQYVRMITRLKPADTDAYLAALQANLAEPGRIEAARAFLSAGREEVEPLLGDVRAPTVVVMGTADPDFPDPKAEAELVAGRMHADVLLVDAAGHYPHAERPDVVAERVVALVRGAMADAA